jgi:uncharacterized membrane protein
MKDDIFLKAFESKMDKNKFKKYDVIRIDNIADAKNTEGRIIAICRRSSYRLANMLDFYLQNADGMSVL